MLNSDVDFAVRGEGEIPLLGLMQELRENRPDFRRVPGIHYRNREQVLGTANQDLIEDLDQLPFPARDSVLNCDYKSYRVHCVSTARGCPYTCSFCADKSIWRGRVRRRSVANVMEELHAMKNKYPIDAVDFIDGTFTYDRGYLERFCHALADSGLDIKWRCTARYDNLDESLLQLMKDANCSGLLFGLESGSDRILKSVGKRTTVEQIVDVSNMVFNSGIPSVTSVLLGLPDEGPEDMKATLDLMRQINTDIFDVNSYVPLPGSRSYESMAEDKKKGIDWGRAAYKSLDNHFSDSITREELKEHLLEAYEIADEARRKTLVRYQATIGVPQ
jgi:radical SAM superfamily enzyme YgiQ (UPF0313 family)